ncbi:salt stress protein, Slr1339 family [Chlorogloeopsis sp. ULAP02]|uniref:salt stress protein, Slr1339 family n=1 Tax=Chlorogloeopsis sp. ULAP02 TaxID=3107926 RepID=UPI0031350F5C
MDSIDKLLAELKTEYQAGKNEQKQSQPTQATPSIPSPLKSASLIDNLLAEVKADFQERTQAEDLRRQQQLEQQRIQQEQIKAKQLQALKEFAQDWLTKLDPFSPEGLWFERFAERYSSKLEAAIDYLKDNGSIK